MIKNIVFDIGNVLLLYKPYEYMESLGYSGGVADRLGQAIFGHRVWQELDRGTYTLKEARQMMIDDNAELEKDINIILSDNWVDMLKPMPATIKVVEELKAKGYKLYLLSNYHKEAIEKVKPENDFFNLFDGGVISCYVNQIKPEIEIYRTLLDKYSLNAEETVFIDDLQKNLAGAKKLNINTILFTDADSLKKELAELGII